MPASNRLISIRSSTSWARFCVSWLTSRAALPASPGNCSDSSSSTSVTAVIAASGVRSSCETSATNRRASASIRRSSPTCRSSRSAVWLKISATPASSSSPLHRGPGPQVALAEPAGGAAQLAHRSQHAAGGQQGEQHRQHQRRGTGRPGQRGQRFDAVLLVVERVQPVHLDAGRLRAAVPPRGHQLGADSEGRGAVAGKSLPDHLALAHGRAQRLGELAGVEPLRGVPVPVHHHSRVGARADDRGDRVELLRAGRQLAHRIEPGDLVHQREHGGVLGLLEDDGAGLPVAHPGHQGGGGQAQHREGEQQSAAQAETCHSGPNRYPNPRTVCTYTGAVVSFSIFARSRCTHASTSRESPR